MEKDPGYGAPDFWDRVGATTVEAAHRWQTTSEQQGRTPNVIDAVVLRMTEVTSDLRLASPQLAFDRKPTVQFAPVLRDTQVM